MPIAPAETALVLGNIAICRVGTGRTVSNDVDKALTNALLALLAFTLLPISWPEFELRGLYVKKMFVGGLPLESTEETVTEMFNEFGKVRSIKLASDVFTGKCKGFGFIEMEGHEARAAIAGLNGKIIGDKSLKVQFEEPRKGGKRGGRRR